MARVRLWRQHVCSCISAVYLPPAVLSHRHSAWDEDKNSCYRHGVFKGTPPLMCITELHVRDSRVVPAYYSRQARTPRVTTRKYL